MCDQIPQLLQLPQPSRWNMAALVQDSRHLIEVYPDAVQLPELGGSEPLRTADLKPPPEHPLTDELGYAQPGSPRLPAKLLEFSVIEPHRHDVLP